MLISKNSIKLVTGVIVLSAFSKAEAKQKPNIVLLIADDVSADDLACYGNKIVKTPNIDQLAGIGIRFNNVFLTASSSSPSRASIVTGRYPHNTGACELHSELGSEQVFFPSILKKNGYYTAQAGKWHFSAPENDFSGPVLASFDKVGGDKHNGGGESGAEKWVETLQQRPRNKPFFMWFAAHDAHRDWDNAIFLPAYKANEVDVKEWYIDNLPSREDIAAYYNEISRFDFYVGEVVNELKRQGVFEQTLIIIMADNGRPFPRAKTRLITDGIKTPFIISYPQGVTQKGAVSESLISAIDIAPTLVEISGSRLSSTFQGISFKSLLTNPARKHRNYAFAEHNWHDYEAYGRMVCNDSLLLIINKRPHLTAEGAIDVMGGGVGQSLKKTEKSHLTAIQRDIFSTNRDTVELYNYKKDSYQKQNIYHTDPVNARYLLKVLKKWQIETADTQPETITPDWYSRETLLPTPEWGKRAEMPGASKKAKRIKNKGPF